MSNPESAFFVLDTHDAPEEAIRALGKTGVDMKKRSLVGKGDRSEETPQGFDTVGDRIKVWGGAVVVGGLTAWGAALTQLGVTQGPGHPA